MLECKLVGITFENDDGIKRSDICNMLKVNQAVDLNPITAKWINEKTGKIMEDKHAVEVLCDGQVCGMIPASINQKVHGNAEQARVIRFTRKDALGFTDDEDVPVVGVTVEIDIDVAKGKSGETPEMLQSFNEEGVTVEFLPIAHEYWLGDVQLKSVTRAVGEGYKPFDAEMIAGFCENKYGMKKQDIVKMWKNLGEVTSGFGTSCHLAMESYSLFGERSLPKMPILRSIVESFEWWDIEIAKVEAFISCVDEGVAMAGLADRIEIHNCKLRVTDYKFNCGCDEISSKHKNSIFPDMPNSKVSKYVIQMSIYGDMMDRSGMDVDDDVTAYVWDDEWRSYTQPRIKNIIETILDYTKARKKAERKYYKKFSPNQ